MLQSIGLTKKQLIKMIQFEGLRFIFWKFNNFDIWQFLGLRVDKGITACWCYLCSLSFSQYITL